jgi:hypothetical protein
VTSAARQQPARRAGSQLRYLLTGARPSQLVQLADTRRTSRCTPLAGGPPRVRETHGAQRSSRYSTRPLDPPRVIKEEQRSRRAARAHGSSAGIAGGAARWSKSSRVILTKSGPVRLVRVGTVQTVEAGRV